MKIGIFGDSFGQYNTWLIHPDTATEADKGRKAWFDYFKDDGYDVENNCKSATDLYYTFKQFKKFYKSYDYIIVLVTAWGRMWLPQLTTMYPWIPGYKNAEFCLEICKDEGDKKILQALLDYYKYVENRDYSMDMQRLMCEQMQSMHDKILMIPCFNNDNWSLVPNYNGPCINDISDIDSLYYNVDSYAVQCRRHGHLNDQNNYIFYQKIIEWIKNDGKKEFVINLSDYKNPTEPLEYNFNTEQFHVDLLSKKVIKKS